VVVKLFDLMIWAHAHESARLQPAALRQLPMTRIRYVGPSRRPSPRMEKQEPSA
jgi:hypothetical protein